MDGIYSQLNKIVRQMKQDGNVIFDVDFVSEKIDLSSMDRTELESRCKKAMTSVSFYQNHLRSVVHGKGIYVDYDKIKSRIVLERLLINARFNEEKKALMISIFEDIINGLPDTNGNQLYFDPDKTDENGELLIFEEKSKEELIEMLQELLEASK